MNDSKLEIPYRRKEKARRRSLPNPGHPDRGYCYNRTQHDKMESELANAWEHAQQLRPGINYGLPLLQSILSDGFNFTRPTARDRAVAATMIQWLGTNCGFAFLQGCLLNVGVVMTGYCPRANIGIEDEFLRALDVELRTAKHAAKARQMLFDLCEPN